MAADATGAGPAADGDHLVAAICTKDSETSTDDRTSRAAPAPPCEDGSRKMDEQPYRYHRWRDTIIRERRIYDVEALTPHGWAYIPYALDALTGMGEDPYSCGEWCDAISDAEAATIARARGLALEMGSAPGRQRPQS